MTSKPKSLAKSSRMPPPEAAASSLQLCRQAQDQLQEAISSVSRTEQQLRENTREVRLELQSCMSRQQEALRCREVCLLSQIELLEQVKTETLQQQLQQLHWLRGQFDVICHQLQNSNSSNDLNNQLTCCMEKLSSLSLNPEETPDVCFHADTRSLRQAITSFGQVTAQKQEVVSLRDSTHSTAQVQSRPTTDQKQNIEQWLLGNPAEGRTENLGEWLLHNGQTAPQPPAASPVSVDFLKAWGQLMDLEAWLVQVPSPISRVRSVSSCSSSFSIEKIDELELMVASEEGEEEMEEVEEEEELSDWLVTPPSTASLSDAERWRRVLKPFRDDWSANDWLANQSPHPPADCSSCCQVTKAVEIENLGQLKCLKTPPAATSPVSPHPPLALEAWLQQVVPLEQSCRANEVCSAYSECVCEENCGKDALSRWLLTQDGRDKNGVPTAAPPTKNTPPTLHHREQEQKVQAILEAWLHPNSAPRWTPVQKQGSSLSSWMAPEQQSSHPKPSSSSSSSSVFLLPLDPDRWVLASQAPPPADNRSEVKPCPPAEEDKWLLRKKSQAQERLVLPTVCDLFSCLKVGGDKDKWLHRAAEQM